MTTIWKFPFAIYDNVTIEMPKGARVLCVQTQDGVACLWAVVDDAAEMEDRSFRIAGTGHPLEESRPYIGTIQAADGAFVFHVFG